MLVPRVILEPLFNTCQPNSEYRYYKYILSNDVPVKAGMFGGRKSTAGCCPTASVLVGAKHREARGGRLVLFYVSCKKYLSVCNSGNCLVNEKSK